MTIYISGPISNTDDYMERFAAAEELLKAKGYTVINPAAKLAYKDPAATTWEEYMGESLKMLATADGIYMLKDWRISRGACIERRVADSMGKEIYWECGGL